MGLGALRFARRGRAPERGQVSGGTGVGGVLIRSGMRSVVGRLAGRATVPVVVPRKDVDLSVDGAHNGAAPGGSEEAFSPQVPFQI